jgi:hypothetical protein
MTYNMYVRAFTSSNNSKANHFAIKFNLAKWMDLNPENGCFYL